MSTFGYGLAKWKKGYSENYDSIKWERPISKCTDNELKEIIEDAWDILNEEVKKEEKNET
jgi:hypothetical protein